MKREQRVWRAMLRGLSSVILISVLGVAAGILAQREADETLLGVSTGLLIGLPWAIILMLWHGFKQMDEFGRQRLTQASAVGFIVVMLASATYFPLQAARDWPALPGWLLWVIGWTTWGAVLGVMAQRDKR